MVFMVFMIFMILNFLFIIFCLFVISCLNAWRWKVSFEVVLMEKVSNSPELCDRYLLDIIYQTIFLNKFEF